MMMSSGKMQDCQILQPPRPVGYFYMNAPAACGRYMLAIYYKKPNWFRRWSAKFFLDLEWMDNPPVKTEPYSKAAL